MTLDEVTTAAERWHLTPLGGFQENGTTTILLGPKEPGFWAFISTHEAFQSASTDPLDTWSDHAISTLAKALGAKALFPFDGPPHHPFITWALQSGEAWQSPVGLLVHKDAGLLVSYRGALVFDQLIDLTAPSTRPCDACEDQPCLSACPVGALSPSGYDVPRCKAHIEVDDVCRQGCRVRLSCPVSQSYGRDPAQTAFHMEAFHPS